MPYILRGEINLKKIIVLFLCFTLSAIFCSCTIVENNTIQSDSGKRYFVLDDTKNEGEIAFSNFSIKYSNSNELKKSTSKTYNGEIKPASNVNEAAKIGASILEKCYKHWTETKTVVVDKNQKANAWIVTGQLLSRKSTSGVGAVVFSVKTGEVLYIGKDIPVS